MSAIRQHDQLPKETTLSLFGNVINFPQVYRGPCEVAVRVTGQQLTSISFSELHFSSTKNLRAKIGFKIEVYKSTDTINSKHVVLMYLGLAWYFLQGSSTVAEIDGTEATGLAGPRSEIVNFVPL